MTVPLVVSIAPAILLRVMSPPLPVPPASEMMLPVVILLKAERKISLPLPLRESVAKSPAVVLIVPLLLMSLILPPSPFSALALTVAV